MPSAFRCHFYSNHELFLTSVAGEYVGLTGASLDGSEMLACGLATHFVPSVVFFLRNFEYETKKLHTL